MGGKGRFGVVGVLLLLAVLAVAVFAPVSSAGHGKGGAGGKKAKKAVVAKKAGKTGVVGHVYSQTNEITGNRVVVFDRYANGLLLQHALVPTGGLGGRQAQNGCTPPGGCPFLDSQGALTLAKGGHFLITVNAGSNTISSFRVGGNGLTLVDQESSHGVFPYSVTTHGNLLYVLNNESFNIAGFRIGGNGSLSFIQGSSQPLTPDAHNGPDFLLPRQVGFDNTGHFLAVTLLGVPDINTFIVDGNGLAGPAIANASANPLPFGFSWDAHNHLLDSEVNDPSGAPNGRTATYSISPTGHLTVLDNKGSNGFAPCWTAVSDKFAYVVNTGAGAPSGATVSVYSDAPNGALSLIQVTPQVGFPALIPFGPAITEFAALDDVLSPDNHYLYVNIPGIFSSTSRLDMYAVAKDGTINLIGSTPSTLPGGLSGLASD
jgi:hypothetical protein